VAIAVAQLIDRAQALVDKRNDLSIPPADWVVYVNRAQQSLDRKIAALDPGFRFATTDFTLTAAPSGATKDLAAASWTPTTRYVALHGLDLSPDTSTRRTIRGRPFRERNHGSLDRWWAPTIYADDRGYDLRGKTLVITPYEAAAGTYRAYCRGGCRLFTSDVDATPLDDQLEDYEEWIAIMAARSGLGIEESETGFMSQRLAELNAEIVEEHERDNGEPIRIADVEADDPDAYGG
jgi:hypothetical protein